MRRAATTDAAVQALRAFGLRYPGVHLKSPWPGHKDLAVNDKTFCSLSIEGEPFSLSCKLPASNGAALSLPFVTPAPYGLRRSGWVTAKVPAGQAVPVELSQAWIDESYRAQAPKKLVKQLDGDAPRARVSQRRRAPVKARRTGRRART